MTGLTKKLSFNIILINSKSYTLLKTAVWDRAVLGPKNKMPNVNVEKVFLWKQYFLILCPQENHHMFEAI